MPAMTNYLPAKRCDSLINYSTPFRKYQFLSIYREDPKRFKMHSRCITVDWYRGTSLP